MKIRKIEKMPAKWLAESGQSAASAPKAGVTLFTDEVCNMQTASVQISADLAGAAIQAVKVNQAVRQDLAKKSSIQGNSMPFF